MAQAPELNDDASMMGLSKDDPTWDHMTSYAIDNDAQTIVVTFEFGYTGDDWNYLQTADFAPTDYSVRDNIKITDGTKEGSIANVKVTAQDGSENNYALYYEYEGAFESFTVPNQVGETEFIYGGQYNYINVNVPYGYDWANVIPKYTLVEKFEDKYLVDNSSVSFGFISGEDKDSQRGSGCQRR